MTCDPAAADQLGEQQSGRTSAEDERGGARTRSDRVDAVHDARRRFDEKGSVGGHALDREDLPSGSEDVFGERARPVRSHAGQVGAQDGATGAAEVAPPATGVGIDRDLLADPNGIDALPDGGHGAYDLVAGSQWEGGEELSVVQMQVGAADSGPQHTDEHFVGTGLRRGDFGDRKAAGPVVDDRLHTGRPGAMLPSACNRLNAAFGSDAP